MGTTVAVDVLSVHEDEHGQALHVRIVSPQVAAYCTNKYPHITLSTATGVAAKHSNTLLAVADERHKLCTDDSVLLRVVGTVGVRVVQQHRESSAESKGSDPFLGLPAHIVKMVREFLETGHAGPFYTPKDAPTHKRIFLQVNLASHWNSSPRHWLLRNAT